MDRTANALWHGGIKDGAGTLSTASGVLKETQYSYGSRFEEGIGTNPEELIAAAHAGCFTMALSGQLDAAGLKATLLQTTAKVTLEKVEGGFKISKIHLTLEASIPDADEAAFEKATTAAKDGCPISKLFHGNAQITLDAKLT